MTEPVVFESVEDLVDHVRGMLRTGVASASNTPRPMAAGAVVQIAGNRFDLSTPAGADALSAFVSISSPLVVKTGPDHISVSDFVRALAFGLPCFAALHWPGYATAFRDVTLDGQAIVLQVWKGHCQQLFGLNGFPGGFGAEVGVYYRSFKRDSLAVTDPTVLAWLLATGAIGLGMWWPWFDAWGSNLDPKIAFDLSFKKQPLISTAQDNLWWQTRWVTYDGFQDRLKKRFPGYSWSTTSVAEMDLAFTVNGKKFKWNGGSDEIVGPL